jgi:AcrR family transcriptional regulator
MPRRADAPRAGGSRAAEEGPEPLSRDRVLRRAMAVADAGGLGSLTMRSLATELGVKPMAVYHYVAGKDEILDGIVDLVFAEMELPQAGGDWRAEITRRATSAREVLRRHPWAVALLESRSAPGPATLRHHDAVLGTLRGAGFSVEMTGHAYALLDAYVYGFAVQEASLPIGPDAPDDAAESIAARIAPDAYPHLVEFATARVLQPGYSFGDEFEFGLNLVLDALERAVDRPAAGQGDGGPV